MPKNSQKTGSWAEDQAAVLLAGKNYTILERNWRFKQKEIDIIARDNDTIVFVEVKARSSDAFGDPEMFVTRKKQGFLVAAANHYLQEKDICLESRFDIVSILVINNNITVKHLESAFYPSLK